MPQSTSQILRGYIHLIGDTLSQRIVNRDPPPNHPLFSSATYLKSRLAVVTGANTGIGLETARQLSAAGATVILACRNVTKANDAIVSIRAANPTADVHFSALDLSSTDSIRSFATSFGARPLQMLVLNGGVMGAEPAVPETHFTVNHVGHALLALLLLPRLAAARGRVVLVSSLTFVVSDLRIGDIELRERGYAWVTAYANSKLAMLQFMHALRVRLGETAVGVYAVHPGEATSDVARYLGSVWMWLHKNVGGLFLLSTAESARTSVYVAGAEEVDGCMGTLFHRVWQTLPVEGRFVEKGDVQQLWDETLSRAGMSSSEVESLLRMAHKVAKEREAA